ncbi:MAG: ABC-F family ATP-binding cassette domain-containing protein [Kouleothrix sp.]
MSILNVGGLTKYYGAELIFSNINFQIAKGDKVALVGVNGAGKSTIMKIIAGIEEPTSGGVHMARGHTQAYLAQEAQFSGENTLLDEMHSALAHLFELQRQISALEHALADTDAPDWEARMEQYGELTHRFEHAGGYEIEHRIERTLHGLGFSEAQYHQPVGQFSGGQKTRAALAAALLADPDLLLLDEPTNHLDLAALEWLERFLKDWDGTLIVISHDRYFLDKVTNRTIEIANGRLDGDYPAGYNRYLELKAEKLELLLKQFQAQQEFIAKTEDFIRRFKAGQRTKEARGREKILNRLKHGYQGANNQWINERIDAPQQQKRLAMSLGTQVRSGDMVLRLEQLVVGFAARTENQKPRTDDKKAGSQLSLLDSTVQLITCPNLEMQRGQRVALMGANGSGKTTLLRTIVGEHPALRGQVRLGHKVVINYYAQAHEGLQMHATVFDEIRRIKPLIKETEARTLLGRFLFSGDDVFKHVGDLSGGERSRVALAQLTLMAGNLLVLDEPTNHLDINAREALELVLNEYNGSILFVSHDRYFIDAVADTIWMVGEGTIKPFNGNYSEFTTWQEAAAREPAAPSAPRTASNGQPAPASRPAAAPAQPAAPADASKPIDRGAEREQRKRQRRLAALEGEIAMLEDEQKKLGEEMTAASIAGDGKRVKALENQYAELHDMLSSRYQEWSASAG